MSNNKQLILLMNTGSTESGQTFYLDVDQTDDFQFNFIQSDISDLTTKYSDYSKDSVLPPTPNNHKVFRMIYDLQNLSSFNFTQANTCYYMIDNTVCFTGVLQLVKINWKTDANGIPYISGYQVHLNGNRANLFKQINNQPLSGLTLSQFDHTFNVENINYYSQQTTGMTYVYIDYIGEVASSQTYQTIYPINPAISGELNFNRNFTDTNFIVPAFYVRELWDEIFFQNGFKYQSEFIENDPVFNSLVIPMNANLQNLTGYTMCNSAYTANIWFQNLYTFNENPEDPYLSVSGETDQCLMFQYQNLEGSLPSPVMWYTDLLGMLPDDPTKYLTTRENPFGGGTTECYSYGQGYLLIPKTGKYQMIINYELFFSTWSQENNTTSNREVDINFYLVNNNCWGGTGTTYNYPYVNQAIDTGGTSIEYNGDFINIFTYTFDSTNSATTASTISFSFDAEYGNFLVGEIKPNILPDSNQGYNAEITPNLQIILNLNSPNFILNYTQIQANQLYKKSFTQSDFIKSICTLFNFSYDILPDGITYYIEPRDIYFANGNTVDWSDRIYTPVEHQFFSNYISNYSYNFTDDNDTMNTFYKKMYDKTYGKYLTSFNDSFITSTQDYNVIFSPTFDVWKPYGLSVGYNPAIYGSFVACLSGSSTKTDYNPRILYLQQGTYSTIGYAEPFINNSVNTANACLPIGQLPFPQNIYSNVSYGDNKLQQNEFYNLTFNTDIVAFSQEYPFNWEQYYPSTDSNGNPIIRSSGENITSGMTIQVGADNFYTMFHGNWMQMISDPNFRIVVLEMYLRPSDLINFKFNTKIIIDRQEFFINQIQNYSFDITKSCRVELIRIPPTYYQYNYPYILTVPDIICHNI